MRLVNVSIRGRIRRQNREIRPWGGLATLRETGTVLQAIYLLCFALLTTLAIVTMVRNLFNVGLASQRNDAAIGLSQRPAPTPAPAPRPTLHPELLDERGRVIEEPLLVMREMSVDDVRNRLDALYDASPDATKDPDTGNSDEPPLAGV